MREMKKFENRKISRKVSKKNTSSSFSEYKDLIRDLSFSDNFQLKLAGYLLLGIIFIFTIIAVLKIYLE
ncbi:MAG: hypothetical protein A2536_09665 [Candidatus Firestonebacteria bacterium RIFOXYD2_FULL_39_29]|nr:MAG: hypothetical protein A2536_09665 [Candidatus Firestonebacteria bacterium RIFOXYD2_FULL_39_29]